MKIVIEIPDYTYESLCDCEGTITIGESIVITKAIRNGTPLDSIISDIEAARDKDKLCEYPYNRCINIIKKAVGDES